MPGAEQPIGGLDVMSLLGPFAKGQMIGQNWDKLKGLAQGGIDQQVEQQAAQRQALQQAMSQAALAREAQDAFLADPSNDNLARFSVFNPKAFETIKATHDMKNEDQQRQDLRDWSALNGMLTSNDWDGAAAHIQKRIEADSKAGLPVQDDQHALDLIKAKDPKALALVKAQLYGALGPDKYTAAYESDAKNALTMAQVDKTKAEAERIKNPPPETGAIVGQDGQPIFYNKNAPPPTGYGVQDSRDVPAGLKGFVTALIGTEKGSTPDAKNPRSSATGDGQFIDATWLRLAKANHPEWTEGKTDAQILALRADQGKSALVTGEYAQENAGVLSAAGIPVTGQSLAMAHKLGPANALRLFTSDVKTPLAKVLGADVMKANPQLQGQTVGSYGASMARQFGLSAVSTEPGDENATGDAFLATLPKGRQELIKAIAEGRAAPPNSRSKAGLAVMEQVQQYDPTADATTLPQRKSTRTAFATGQPAENVKAINTVVGHLVGLNSAITRLQNSDVPAWNKVKLGVKKQYDPATQKALADFGFYKTAVANELTKVFRGSHGAEADIQSWMKQLEDAGSDTGLHQAVHSMVDGISSRLDALKEQYKTGMGKEGDPPNLGPHTVELLDQLSAGAPSPGGGNVAPTPQAVATLKANPASASQFDQIFGAGASKRYLTK